MQRQELEKYLGKTVEITLFDGDILKGELHKTGEEQYENNPDLYLPRDYYFVVDTEPDTIFRSSHVTKIK